MTFPTLRAISGAPATTHLKVATTALLVIDFQLEYFDGGRLALPDALAALEKAKSLVVFADAHRIPVFHIQHIGPANGPLFATGSETVKFHPELQPASHHTVVEKTTASSFASTDLHLQLQARDIETVVICGLMTHMCVSTAARDARPLGYRVLVAGDAAATRSIDGWDGGVVTHTDLHRAALTEIADSFAEVLPARGITTLELS